MIIEVTVNLSRKEVDSIVKAMDPGIRRIIVDEWCIKIDTPDNSHYNIERWMSEERKQDFRYHMNREFPEFSFEVVSIKLSK